MNNRAMKIGSFIQNLKNKANSAIKSNLALRPNYLKDIMEAFFSSRYTKQFKEHLYLIRKTGNVVDLLGYIKNLFDLNGIRNDQLVPCVTTINKLSKPLHCFYYNICQPEKTYSGFRADLVTLVRTSHYLMTGSELLKRVAVDICGDGVEIGNAECTRMVFRFLYAKAKISPQSSDACFTFACFKCLCRIDWKLFKKMNSLYSTKLYEKKLIFINLKCLRKSMLCLWTEMLRQLSYVAESTLWIEYA